MPEPIRVAVVDDQALLRGSFRVLIESEPGLAVVGEAADGLEAVDLARRVAPDVMVMDVRMPHLDGVEATRRICALPDPAPRVLILTMFDLDAYVFEGLRAGASGFLLKDAPPGELLTAIRVVADGESLLSPSVTRRLIAEFIRRPAQPAAGGPGDPPGLADVTEREREVLILVARGLTNAEISQRLFVTTGTVKTHVSRLLAKLGARDRAQLVIAAYESGLVEPNR